MLVNVQREGTQTAVARAEKVTKAAVHGLLIRHRSGMTKKSAFMLTTADHWVELEADPLARFDLDHDEAVEAAGY
ncbi:hypothetical protein [Streptomyces sp. NPDC046727]|uniref:hypothetical protein n=1 Tax=Streptomyces sp. NPDC046727 TaxID=3155373 RepID=UPI003401AAB7